ncbi:hypothetical protein J8L98_21525 [Pseudoalteromonas sp. MMG013]|uniref:hypothetical protein n=1 Tax=Pseudoalteromonas sp. MMG013 TaxID=2822687 RepID=UPI001B3798D4|nr:hypothetical protein [Pseudoalteromonas sp. MMG013]MBQ4864275.1 hypothetical protein [Pseudoalteromonas sp. MMG013]
MFSSTPSTSTNVVTSTSCDNASIGILKYEIALSELQSCDGASWQVAAAPAGDKGDLGAVGIKGDKGDTGNVDAKGDKGI